MNRILTVLLCLPLFSFAQSSAQLSSSQFYNAVIASQNAPARENYDHVMIPLSGSDVAASVSRYYTQHHEKLNQPQTGLRLLHARQTAIGWHLSYQQTYNGVDISGAVLKVNINHSGTTLSVFDNLEQTSGWSSFSDVTSLSGTPAILVVDGNPSMVYQRTQGAQRIFVDAGGKEFWQKDTRLYFSSDDTVVSAKVFLPDPLTPIGVIAGLNNTYKHFNDSDYALLNDQRVDVGLPVTFDGSLFRLQNKYARIYDTSFKAPNIAPATSSSPAFNFTRKQSGFKDVMALYHVTSTQEYLHSLGIDEVKYQLKIDAHSSTNDQSYFEYQGDTTLNFGTGGVPDAEDGDVIVHEFTHAVSYSITPSVNMSTERRAMEEGMCDVMAAIRSKKYTSFNWRKVFNWDAPNPFASGVTPFWNGRNANSAKTYDNITSDPYSSSEIWSSTLLDIEEQIGSDSTVILMFASLASFADNTTMPQAAKLFMQADSILFDKFFGWKIGPVFNARKLGNFPTGLSEQRLMDQQLAVSNSMAFASGTGNAVLTIPVTSDVEIYDMQGRRVIAYEGVKGELELRSQEFLTGIFFIKVISPDAQGYLKLIRY